MKKIYFLHSALLVAWLLPLLSSCSSTKGFGQRRVKYDPPAYRPNNPDDVRVKVSLDNRMVYVMEKERPLLVAATCGGKPGHETPRGTFRAYNKIWNKRSGSYGFHVRGNEVRGGERSKMPRGYRYVGYPMPYWVEFSPGYGFHEGYVHPSHRSHGCLRLSKGVADKFYQLVRPGTPIVVANSQPEDRTLGRNHRRPNDYLDPDPPVHVLLSETMFKKPGGSPLIN